MWRKLLCKLGRHSWLYDSDKHTANRCCRHCNRWEHPVYDMTYGDKDYAKGWYQYK